MKIKAILSDLDGASKNIQFSLATGRAYFAQVSDIIRELNLSPLHITNGGGMIINWKILLHSSANKMSESEVKKHKKNVTRDCKDIEVIQFLSRNNYYGLDITSEGSTKHTAVLEYAKILGFASHEMAENGACGYKIAMGNAPKELKEIADRVVSTVDNGGMKEALEHIISKL